jgi:hypothetical protein
LTDFNAIAVDKNKDTTWKQDTTAASRKYDAAAKTFAYDMYMPLTQLNWDAMKLQKSNEWQTRFFYKKGDATGEFDFSGTVSTAVKEESPLKLANATNGTSITKGALNLAGSTMLAAAAVLALF